MRIFRQSEPGNWDGVFAEIRDALLYDGPWPRKAGEMSNYARIAHALKRPGIDVISRDTPVSEIDWGGSGIHARVTSAFQLWHRWGSDDRHRDLSVLTVGQLIELGIPRRERLREPNHGAKAVDAIFYVFDHVGRPDAVGWIGA